MSDEPTPRARPLTARVRMMVIATGVLALLYFGLRFESDVGKVCTVCASELTIRRRGLALSEYNRLWEGQITEEVHESDASKEYLGTSHVHTWETWSNLYIALNGRSGGHPFVRWHPIARAWRFNARFPAAVRSFAASGPDRLEEVRAMFLLPRDWEDASVVGQEVIRDVESCKRLFEECGEKVPEGWQRLLSLHPR